MKQEPKWGRLMIKAGGQKSHATVPFRLYSVLPQRGAELLQRKKENKSSAIRQFLILEKPGHFHRVERPGRAA